MWPLLRRVASSEASTISAGIWWRPRKHEDRKVGSSQVCSGNDFPDMWMDAEMYWFQPRMLASSSLSSAVLRRETEEERHMKRQPSKGGHHTALFADCSMHTSIPNHTAVNQCGGLGMERFKVNKHHSPLAESAGGYVNLGMCASSSPLCPQLTPAIFK